MIEIRELTKRYGSTPAVDGLSFTAQPGRITGFLGPNGSGKTTTLRVLLGLERPTAGLALINGQEYTALADPSAVVGAVLDAGWLHPGRTVRNHLEWLAALAAVPGSRIPACLDDASLTEQADVVGRKLSLGQKQRLAIAAAFLAEPKVLVLDEPTNGLDPEGVRWLRERLHRHAAAGATVLLASHLLSECEQLADDLVVIGQQGRLVQSSSIEDYLRHAERFAAFRVSTERPDQVVAALVAAGADAAVTADGAVVGRGLGRRELTAVTTAQGVDPSAVDQDRPNLEDAILHAGATQSATEQQVPTT